ncbi:MAG: OsmC family protein [Anaerolineae bacterium]|jgi:putative redox protein
MSVLANVTWIEDRRFVGRASSGHAIVVDASKEKQGPSPMELLLIGMAGCTGYDVMNILEKKRQVVTRFEVSARAERAEEPPRVYTVIEVEYVLRGRGINPKAVEDAIRLSKEKYCSASVMLEKTAKITTSYRIEEES